MSAVQPSLKVETSPSVLKPARKSRNSIFSASWAVSSPSSSSPSAPPSEASPSQAPAVHIAFREPQRTEKEEKQSPAPAYQPIASDASASILHEPGHDDPKAPSAAIPVELAAFLKTTSVQPPLQLRSWLHSDLMLGEGRHALVYLASYLTVDGTQNLRLPCALKRIHADRESQLSGLTEAWVLKRLAEGANSTGIIRLLAVQDERDHHTSKLMDRKTLGAPAEDKGSCLPSDRSLKFQNYPTHDRSFSDAVARSPVMSTDSSQLRSSAGLSGLPTSPRARAHLCGPPVSTPSSPVLSAIIPAVEDVPDWPGAAGIRRSRSMKVAGSGGPKAPASPKLPTIDQPRLILLLELCPYGNLAGFTRSRASMIGYELWLRWAKDLAHAVAHAHSRHIAHLDIKLDNIMVTEAHDVKLADWGMSHFLSPSQPLPTDGLGLGTPNYCSPELVQSGQRFGLPADIFALGVTLYCLIVGREPYAHARSAVERMLWISRGAFWSWEERERMGGIGSRTHSNPSVSAYEESAKKSERRPSISEGSNVACSAPERYDVLRPLFTSDDGTLQCDGEVWRSAEVALSTAHGQAELHEPHLISPFSNTSFQYDQDAKGRYDDGTPFQWFLDGGHPVPERVRDTLRRMTSPDPGKRPDANEVVSLLDSL